MILGYEIQPAQTISKKQMFLSDIFWLVYLNSWIFFKFNSASSIVWVKAFWRIMTN